MSYSPPNWNGELTERGTRTLRALNAAVAATEGSIEGNLFYYHATTPQADDPPEPGREYKRRNLVRALAGTKRILETGFNAGHSALLALDTNPGLSYVGVDIASHNYTRPCAAILQATYQGRVEVHFGDSKLVLAKMLIAPEREAFDAVHIDGGHDGLTFELDLLHALLMTRPGGLLIIDDYHLARIAQPTASMISRGIISPETFGGTWEGEDSLAVRFAGL